MQQFVHKTQTTCSNGRSHEGANSSCTREHEMWLNDDNVKSDYKNIAKFGCTVREHECCTMRHLTA